MLNSSSTTSRFGLEGSEAQNSPAPGSSSLRQKMQNLGFLFLAASRSRMVDGSSFKFLSSWSYHRRKRKGTA